MGWTMEFCVKQMALYHSVLTYFVPFQTSKESHLTQVGLLATYRKHLYSSFLKKFNLIHSIVHSTIEVPLPVQPT